MHAYGFPAPSEAPLVYCLLGMMTVAIGVLVTIDLWDRIPKIRIHRWIHHFTGANWKFSQFDKIEEANVYFADEGETKRENIFTFIKKRRTQHLSRWILHLRVSGGVHNHKFFICYPDKNRPWKVIHTTGAFEYDGKQVPWEAFIKDNNGVSTRVIEIGESNLESFITELLNVASYSNAEALTLERHRDLAKIIRETKDAFGGSPMLEMVANALESGVDLIKKNHRPMICIR